MRLIKNSHYHRPSRLSGILGLAILAIPALLLVIPQLQRESAPIALKGPDRLSSNEFAGLIRDFSEPGGYFRSDNFVSNETSYLHIVGKLREIGATGGAYIGVGPEQNFTYIAKIRPKIAFIIDIRRQAIIQHLMFKALFHLSKDRNQFLSRLLSRPLPQKNGFTADAAIEEFLVYLSKAPPDDRAFASNLAEIRNTIQQDFHFTLSLQDISSLEYIYGNFKREGLDISFRLDVNGRFGSGFFPTLKELILEPDLLGKPGNFLISSDDYAFVKEMHERNLIVPVVGDFGGSKAFVSVAGYLRQHGYTVSAFYTSNVEQYLFGDGMFAPFVANVRKLPITDQSCMIRTVFDMFVSHPARPRGHQVTTLLQPIRVFLKDYDEHRYTDYEKLVTTNYIAAESPR